MKRCVPLESAAEAVCNQSSIPPLIFQMPPEQGRKVLEEAQDTPVYKYPADISSDCIDTGAWGSIPVYYIAPKGKNPETLYSISTAQAGYLAASTHMKSWSGNLRQEPTHWWYFLNTAVLRKRNIPRQSNSAIISLYTAFPWMAALRSP